MKKKKMLNAYYLITIFITIGNGMVFPEANSQKIRLFIQEAITLWTSGRQLQASIREADNTSWLKNKEAPCN